MKLFSILLSTLLVVFLISVLFLSQISPLKREVTKNFQETPETELYFQPNPLFNGCYSKQTVDIFINSFTNHISSTQIELLYDPFIFSDFSISPSDENFFGDKKSYQVDLNEVRSEYGRASLTMETSEGFSERLGKGKIGSITFIANPIASFDAQVVFLNKTNVLGKKSRNSLLKKTSPLIIYCQR